LTTERPEAFPAPCKAISLKEARAQGWDTLSNGDLLKAAEEAGFEVLLTTNTNLPHQQNLKGRKLAIVILSFVVVETMQAAHVLLQRTFTKSEFGCICEDDQMA
jgi:hypothetical protein